MKEITIALRVFVVLAVLTGLVYPLVVTGVAQAAFPYQANGSMIREDGNVVGSSLIGQHFEDPKFFWCRPSATSPDPYNGASSSGSNLGPTNPDLKTVIEERVRALKAADPDNNLAVPTDLVTASGSGLDPHISLAAAEYQIPRIARTRGTSEQAVEDLVRKHTTAPSLGFLGMSVVNVVELNFALEASL